MRVEELKNKKVLILGFGREGRDSFQFLRKLFPNKTLGVADVAIISLLQNQKPKTKNQKLIKEDKNVRWHLGEGYLQAIKNYDVIIKSPGVLPHLPEIEAAFKQKKITSATELFFENCPGIIIGVTGTKGKGTTSGLIYSILREAGLRVKLVGNLGRPALSHISPPPFPPPLRGRGDIPPPFPPPFREGGLRGVAGHPLHREGGRGGEIPPPHRGEGKGGIFVYELSSHQLYNLKKSPHIAVLLNLYPDHLDYYKNLKEYQKAKENITRHQTKDDFFIYDADDKIVREIAKKTKARGLAFGFKTVGKRVPSIPLLPGKHNILNIKAAISVAKIFGIKDKDIRKAIKKFKPAIHRLEFVGEYNGIKFYNDSAATVPEATMAALDALRDKVQTIILGGSDKGSNYRQLAKKISQSKIKNVILFPSTGEKILLELSDYPRAGGGIKHFFVKNMKEAVELSYQWTGQGKICLLSPASASFTLFRDYKQRGDLFKRYIKDLNSKSQIPNHK